MKLLIVLKNGRELTITKHTYLNNSVFDDKEWNLNQVKSLLENETLTIAKKEDFNDEFFPALVIATDSIVSIEVLQEGYAPRNDW